MSHSFNEGVSPNSTIYFHTPMNCIPDFLYYPLCIGHFYCSAGYKVDRTSYDSFLLLYTKRGKGTINAGGITRELHPGEICLLDCYCPHLYQASEVWELEWIHFDGGNSRAFFDYLRDDMPFFYTLLDSPAQLEAIWNRLYETLLKKNNINELLISQDISQILTLLGLSKERREKQKTASDFMDISLKYIHRHLDEDISLNALAARVSLSPFYFTRKFKEETGYTPYRYILISRINLAKFYLKSSRDTLKNIGFSCGCHSEHSFCTTFKKEVGVTPTEYRHRSE